MSGRDVSHPTRRIARTYRMTMDTSAEARRVNSRNSIVLAIYFSLALVLTYPLVAHLQTHQPGHGIDDPALTWSLWWVRFSLFDLGTSPLYTDYLFYPLGINLVAYTPTFLNGVLSIPLQWVFGVIVAQNLGVYFSLVASAYGMFLFACEVLSRLTTCPERSQKIAATLAGAFYGFGAWHINYVWGGNFFLLSNEWIPFYALYLIRSHKARWKNGALAGFFSC